MKSNKPDYGLDAPKLVRRFLIGGILAVIAGILLAIYVTGWLGTLGSIAFAVGITFFVQGVLMILSSRCGKFIMRNRLLDELKLNGNETVLDVGCGRGLLFIGAAKRLPEGKAVGLDLWSQYDLSNNSASAALKNAEIEGVKDYVEIKDGDMRKIPFGEDSFDTVVASLSIHNIYTAEGRNKAIQEIERVLKPGGKVALMDMQHAQEYTDHLSNAGMKNVNVSGLHFQMFPPVRIVTAHK
jgi:SAM-dependent methyltransferase